MSFLKNTTKPSYLTLAHKESWYEGSLNGRSLKKFLPYTSHFHHFLLFSHNIL